MVSLALVSRLCSFLLASLQHLHLRTSPQLSKALSVYLATLTLEDHERACMLRWVLECRWFLSCGHSCATAASSFLRRHWISPCTLSYEHCIPMQQVALKYLTAAGRLTPISHRNLTRIPTRFTTPHSCISAFLHASSQPHHPIILRRSKPPTLNRVMTPHPPTHLPACHAPHQWARGCHVAREMARSEHSSRKQQPRTRAFSLKGMRLALQKRFLRLCRAGCSRALRNSGI